MNKKWLNAISLAVAVALAILFVRSCMEMEILSKAQDLGDGYYLDHDGRYGVSVLDPQNIVIVHNTILEYNYDTSYIIVSQRPWSAIPGVRSMNYTEANRAFEQSTFRQYWIIRKKEKKVFDEVAGKYSGSVYGPYSRFEYSQKRMELGVPKELTLDYELYK